MDLNGLYQEIILDHYKHPRGKAALDDALASAHHVNPTCGDEVTVDVATDADGRLRLGYQGQGCSISQAAASMLTQVAEGKEVKNFGGQEYILEQGIFADLAIVKAWKADETGNVVFRKTARNFNVPAATCGKVCVVEVEEIVQPGELDADAIHLPGVYVQRLICGAPYDKKIEFRTTRTTDVG